MTKSNEDRLAEALKSARSHFVARGGERWASGGEMVCLTHENWRVIKEALATHEASRAEVPDAEIDARLDRQYIAGAKAGYNLGGSGDREGFNRMIDARNDHILAARKEKNDG